MLSLLLSSGVGADPIFGWTPIEWIWVVVVVLFVLFIFGAVHRKL